MLSRLLVDGIECSALDGEHHEQAVLVGERKILLVAGRAFSGEIKNRHAVIAAAGDG